MLDFVTAIPPLAGEAECSMFNFHFSIIN